MCMCIWLVSVWNNWILFFIFLFFSHVFRTNITVYIQVVGYLTCLPDVATFTAYNCRERNTAACHPDQLFGDKCREPFFFLFFLLLFSLCSSYSSQPNHQEKDTPFFYVCILFLIFYSIFFSPVSSNFFMDHPSFNFNPPKFYVRFN